MFRKLIILLCLFMGCIGGVGVGFAIPDDPETCQLRINSHNDNVRSESTLIANTVRLGHLPSAAQMRSLAIAESDYKDLVICAKNFGLEPPCKHTCDPHKTIPPLGGGGGGAGHGTGAQQGVGMARGAHTGINHERIKSILHEAATHPYHDRNYTMLEGEAVSKEEANEAGKLWVGKGYARLDNTRGEQIGWASANKLKTYRFPSDKDGGARFQANFERYEVPYDQIKRKKRAQYDISNGHLNIIR